MPSWRSPEELQRDATIFIKFVHALLGLYVYECFISFDFDWDFITGKKKFRWPLIFYFANRYLLLFAMIGIAIGLDTLSPLDCQALYTFNQIAGDSAVGLASINLSIRTMAIWSHNRYIIGVLVLIILGHWSLILQGVQLKAVWVEGAGCSITETNNKILAAIFIYSMCFDLIVLILNVIKLSGLGWSAESRSRMGHSRLTHMIFADGLIYFIVAFLANFIATIFMLLNLNQIMSVIFNVPAVIFSTIVACRAVRRLTNFSNDGPEMFTTNQNSGGKGAKNTTMSLNFRSAIASRPGVHVQMETFTHQEDQNDIFQKSKSGSDTDVEAEAEPKKGSY